MILTFAERARRAEASRDRFSTLFGPRARVTRAFARRMWWWRLAAFGSVALAWIVAFAVLTAAIAAITAALAP